MTVTNQTYKVSIPGNGSGTDFSFSPMVIFNTTDIEVTLTDSSGAETTLSEGTGANAYSVTAASGSYPSATGVTGFITYPEDEVTPLSSGNTITIKRVLPFEQTLDLENQGGYFPDLQEVAFDKGVMIALQQQEELDRVVRTAVSDASVNLTLPTATARAGKFFTFDATGAPTVSSSAIGIAVTPFVETLADDTTAGEFLTTLGVSSFAQTILDDTTSAAVRSTIEAASTGSNTFTAENTFSDDVNFNGLVKFGTTELTIASGAIQPTRGFHTVDTESDAATDNLGTISTSGVTAGTVLVLRPESASRVVTVLDGIGNIELAGGNFVMSSLNHTLTLMYDGSNWREVSRAPSVGSIARQSASSISGGQQDFTSPFATTHAVEIDYEGMSLDGSTDEIVIQVGTGTSGSPSFVTTGYDTRINLSNSGAVSGHTNGFQIQFAGNGALSTTGHCRLAHTTGNSWVGTNMADGANSTDNIVKMSGNVSAGAAVTQIRITSNSTNDDLDAGNVSVMWYGEN